MWDTSHEVIVDFRVPFTAVTIFVNEQISKRRNKTNTVSYMYICTILLMYGLINFAWYGVRFYLFFVVLFRFAIIQLCLSFFLAFYLNCACTFIGFYNRHSHNVIAFSRRFSIILCNWFNNSDDDINHYIANTYLNTKFMKNLENVSVQYVGNRVHLDTFQVSALWVKATAQKRNSKVY